MIIKSDAEFLFAPGRGSRSSSAVIIWYTYLPFNNSLSSSNGRRYCMKLNGRSIMQLCCIFAWISRMTYGGSTAGPHDSSSLHSRICISLTPITSPGSYVVPFLATQHTAHSKGRQRVFNGEDARRWMEHSFRFGLPTCISTGCGPQMPSRRRLYVVLLAGLHATDNML